MIITVWWCITRAAARICVWIVIIRWSSCWWSTVQSRIIIVRIIASLHMRRNATHVNIIIRRGISYGSARMMWARISWVHARVVWARISWLPARIMHALLHYGVRTSGVTTH